MLKPSGLVALLMTGFVIAGCTAEEPDTFPSRVPVQSPERSKTRVIGLVGTMSGADSWRGEDAFEGADVAVAALNRMLEPGEPGFDLVTHDDRGDPRVATELIQQLAGSDRTVGIVYAGPTEALPPAEPVLEMARIPALLTYGDLYTRRLLSAHVFQISPSYLWQARVITRYLTRDRGYRRLGAITSNSLNGQAARTALSASLSELGTPQARSIVYPQPSELLETLEDMRSRRVQALVLEGSPSEIETVLSVLDRMGAGYRTTAIARSARRGEWRPQVAAFDLAISRSLDADVLRPGLVAAETYARGAHYLPVPSLEEFHRTFVDWWRVAEDAPEPLGWERRAYEAVHMIGWASRRIPTGGNVDVARVLEKMRGKRVGGLNVTFGPDDHTSVDQGTVGLWVVPRPGPKVRERAATASSGLPWVPLARGFAIDGERTDIPAQDWKYLFTKAPPKRAPAPRFGRQRFGVTTPRSDPVH